MFRVVILLSTSVLYKVRFFRVLYYFNNSRMQHDIAVRFALKHKEDFCRCSCIRNYTCYEIVQVYDLMAFGHILTFRRAYNVPFQTFTRF